MRKLALYTSGRVAPIELPGEFAQLSFGQKVQWVRRRGIRHLRPIMPKVEMVKSEPGIGHGIKVPVKSDVFKLAQLNEEKQ